jgi:hypothetical protein
MFDLYPVSFSNSSIVDAFPPTPTTSDFRLYFLRTPDCTFTINSTSQIAYSSVLVPDGLCRPIRMYDGTGTFDQIPYFYRLVKQGSVVTFYAYEAGDYQCKHQQLV